MPAAIHLIQADTPARADLADLLAARGATVTLSQPVAEARVPACDAAVFLCDEDPLAPGGVPASGVVLGWADAAAAAGARFILCSSVLLYADGGEAELMANDPELGDLPELKPLGNAELEMFGSSAEVMLLRLGILLGPDGSAAADLAERVKAGSLPIPDEGNHFVSLLDRATLADALVEVAPSKLHGGWDLVAAEAPLGELIKFVAVELTAPEPVVVSLQQAIAAAGPESATRWLTSRKVTGRDLRETGAAGPRDWKDIIRNALS
jgi:hypothetical protein